MGHQHIAQRCSKIRLRAEDLKTAEEERLRLRRKLFARAIGMVATHDGVERPSRARQSTTRRLRPREDSAWEANFF